MMTSKELFEKLDHEVMCNLPTYTFARKKYDKIKEEALCESLNENLNGPSKSQMIEKLNKELEGGKIITLSATNVSDFINHLCE